MINELSILDDIFNDAYAAFPSVCAPCYSPDTDVLETKNDYLITMNLPGLSQKYVDISLKEGILTIASAPVEENEKKDKKENDDVVYLIRERRSTQFSRCFKLPRDTDSSAITAAFKNGVLEVKIPRKEAEQPKRIAISAA